MQQGYSQPLNRNDLAHQSVVEFGIELKLSFDEIQRIRQAIGGGGVHTIHRQLGLFHLDGLEGVPFSIYIGIPNQLKEQTGKRLKQAVEQIIGLHALSGS